MASTPKQKAAQNAFKAMLAGKKGKAVNPANKTPNSIGSSGEMVGGPAKKGQTPKKPTDKKKTSAKIDMMLAKAMPGIGMPGVAMPKKKAMKKGKKC